MKDYIMKYVKKIESGFTIIELLIVIVVIGILAGLVLTAFTGIQQKSRDTERQTDIKALQVQIEAFIAQKAYYPSLTDMNDRTATTGFVAVNLKGLDANAFNDPKSSSSVLVATPSVNAYAYAVTNTAGTSCEADDTTCTKYVLTATLEGTINGLGTFSKNNL